MSRGVSDITIILERMEQDDSHEGVLNPFLLAFWLPVLLYLVSWGLDRRKRARTKAGL
jgi:hypothetical protein